MSIDELIKGKDGIRILPYVEVNGTRTASDDFMKRLFLEMVKEGSIKSVFYQGEVKDEHQFLTFIKNPNNFPVIAFHDELPASVAWVNGVCKNHAFCHHWFYRRVWGKKSLEVARRIIDYWFSFPGDNGPLLDVLLGMTPASNRRAVNFAKRVGFRILGEIPKIAGGDAAVISYLDREDYESSRSH